MDGEVAAYLGANRFFCYTCEHEIGHLLPNLKCPHCHGGFVIELDQIREILLDQVDPESDDSEAEDGPVMKEMLKAMLVDAGYGTDEVRSLMDIYFDQIRSARAGSRVGTGGGGNAAQFMRLIANHTYKMCGSACALPESVRRKFKLILVVIITEKEKEQNLTCAICCEEFIVNEPVRKLACEHIYHENCLIPWLEWNDTCPLCRKLYCGDELAEDPGGADRALIHLIRIFPPKRSSNIGNPSTSSGSGSTRSSGTRGKTPYRL